MSDDKYVARIRRAAIAGWMAIKVVPVLAPSQPQDTERIEAIIHDWMCGCDKGQRCPDRVACREAAEQIVAERSD